MTTPAEALADPVGTVISLVAAADPALGHDLVRRVVEQVGGGRSKRRRLAVELAGNPSVLTTGRSPASKVAGDLMLALRAAGATGISPPWCAGCGRRVTSMQRRGEHWYCAPCFVRPEVCAGCGNTRQVAFRDRQGRPRCSKCPDRDPRDPLLVLVEVITMTDPGLPAEAVTAAIGATVTKQAHLQKLAWLLQDKPELLTGDGAKAPFPVVLRLIDALCETGAARITRPACPRCRRVITLSKQRDGLRICRNCCARARVVPCTKCGTLREPAARDGQGRPLCPYCLASDPVNLEECVRCQRRRQVSTRTSQGPVCATCNPPGILTCSSCGRTAPCTVSKITGQPRCGACARSWARCSKCGQLAPARAGTRDAPLCGDCAVPGPGFFKTCPACGSTGRLIAGACRRCHLRQRLGELLADSTGNVRPELQALRQTLAAASRPATVLTWLSSGTSQTMLTELAAGLRPLSHATLDELPASKPLTHLRSVLVAAGTLPARDEHFVQLERWTTQTVAGRADPQEKEILHRYAVWHVLRRLRHRIRSTRATHGQAGVARRNIAAAVTFLNWLAARDLTLTTCLQADLDQWTADASTSQRGHTGHFIRWARNQKLTSLDFPATRWAGPTRVIDTEGRWEQARRLLHDDTPKPGDRVAGLLVLLYAQQPATISRLTLGHVQPSSGKVHLRLGREPVILPGPLAGLVLRLVATRQGHATTGDQGASPMAAARRTPRPADQPRPAQRTPPPDRHPPRTGPFHRPVPAGHRTPRRAARPHARHPHRRRRRLAARLHRRLDELRRRRQPTTRHHRFRHHPGRHLMASWQDLEQGAPRIARPGRARLDQARVVLLGTLRRDGSPRISPVEPYFARGQLMFGAMAWSGKARDLLRDPRCVMHSPISAPDAGEAELKVYGLAALADDPHRQACRDAWWLREPRAAAEVFVLDVTEAVLIEWDLKRGRMATTHWSPRRGLREQARRYP